VKRSAYTVLEFMITISVLSLIFIFFSYRSQFIEELRFENACSKIMTDIGYLQNTAINTESSNLPWIEFDVEDGTYTCYSGEGKILKDPLSRKPMHYHFLSSVYEKNFRNVQFVSIIVYYKNKNASVQKLEFNRYGGAKITEKDDSEIYDNEDNKSSNDWDYLEIDLANLSLGTSKKIKVDPLTLNMKMVAAD
jgi:hypothetical protein